MKIIKKKILGTVKGGEEKDHFLNWLAAIRTIREKEIKHGLTYPFRWNKRASETIENLNEFLSNVWNDNYPRDIFTDTSNYRLSYLKLKGTKNSPLKTSVIESYFKSYLTYHDHHYLCDHVGAVFDRYRKYKIGKKPDHPPIQSHIMTSEERAVAMEIPVWNAVSGSKKYFIGHVDLVLIEDGVLTVSDYKPRKQDMLKSLPQVTAYALILKKRLEQLGHFKMEIRCNVFTINEAIEWDPNVLLPKIIDFIREQDGLRSSRMMYSNGKKKEELLALIEKF